MAKIKYGRNSAEHRGANHLARCNQQRQEKGGAIRSEVVGSGRGVLLELYLFSMSLLKLYLLLQPVVASLIAISQAQIFDWLAATTSMLLLQVFCVQRDGLGPRRREYP